MHYGHYKKTSSIISKIELDKISEIIQNVEFIHSKFQDSFKNIKSGDFIYLISISNSKSFVNYVADGFKLETHKILFDLIKNLEQVNLF